MQLQALTTTDAVPVTVHVLEEHALASDAQSLMKALFLLLLLLLLLFSPQGRTSCQTQKVQCEGRLAWQQQHIC